MADQATMKSTKASKSSDTTDLDDLHAMIDLLKADMKELTRAVANVGMAEAQRAKSAVKAKGEAIREAGEEQYDALRVQAEEYGRTTGQYVRENPTTALGIAAGLGLVVGFMLSGRR